MVQILDCSGGHLDGQAVRNADYDGVIRYLKKEDPSSVVPINAAERQSLINAGRSVAYIYQHVSKGRVTQGRTAGQHDARWAVSQLPQGAHARAIYGVVVDYDAPASDFAKIIDYARGWCDVISVGCVGAYGKDTVLQALRDAGVVSWFWQTAAWSGGRKFTPRHLYQKVGYVNVGGVVCDVSDCSGNDWGQEGGSNMPSLDSQDIDQIVYAMKARVITADNFRDFGDNRNPGDCLRESARSSLAAAQGVATLSTKVDSLLTIAAQILNHPDITPDALQAMINTAITNAAPSIAAIVANQACQALKPELLDLLSSDNEEEANLTADRVLQLISQKLATAAAGV